MNPSTLAEAKELFDTTKKTALTTRNISTIVAPPHMFLHALSASTRAKRLQFAAQNIHSEIAGAEVGEVSAMQAKDIGVTYALVGHSAHRNAGETDEGINKKIITALSTKLTPVLFVGEQERDAHGNFLHALRKQVVAALEGVEAKDIKNIVFVYEPVWAISTNKSQDGEEEITANDMHKMVLYIQKVLAELHGLPVARKAQILYGGSVNSQNTTEILSVPGVSGAVVGAASLDAKEFRSILQAANKA